MNRKKQLWTLVGGNGAGKSTFYRLYLQPLGIPFVNADVIARELAPDDAEAASYKAAQIAERLRYDLLYQGSTFCFETVFSHPTKIDFLAHAKALGYEIIMVFVHLSNPSLNKARIHHRVNEGGHGVPEDKVESRIIRTLANVKAAMGLCDEVRLLDNSRFDNPFVQVASVIQGQLTWQQTPPPSWATAFFEEQVLADSR